MVASWFSPECTPKTSNLQFLDQTLLELARKSPEQNLQQKKAHKQKPPRNLLLFPFIVIFNFTLNIQTLDLILGSVNS